MMNTNALLKQGIAALKAGQKTEACRLLKQVVEQDKDNEAAWLWLSGAMDTDHERIRCLRETLRINPNNEHARHGLEKLESKFPHLNRHRVNHKVKSLPSYRNF
jgi:predicted Zn-dependent protease